MEKMAPQQTACYGARAWQLTKVDAGLPVFREESFKSLCNTFAVSGEASGFGRFEARMVTVIVCPRPLPYRPLP